MQRPCRRGCNSAVQVSIRLRRSRPGIRSAPSRGSSYGITCVRCSARARFRGIIPGETRNKSRIFNFVRRVIQEARWDRNRVDVRDSKHRISVFCCTLITLFVSDSMDLFGLFRFWSFKNTFRHFFNVEYVYTSKWWLRCYVKSRRRVSFVTFSRTSC